MKCEFDLCLYNKDNMCAVKEPVINSYGMCGTCMVVSLDKDLLGKEKERQLQDIEP